MEWLAVPSCRGSSPPRNWNCVSCISGRFFTTEPSVPSLAKSNSPLSYRCAHRAKRGLWKQNQEYRSHFKSKTMELTCTLTLSGNCSSFPSSALSSSLFCTFSHFSLPTPGLPPSPGSHLSYIPENNAKSHEKTLHKLPPLTCSWARIFLLPSHDQGWRVPCFWLGLGPPLAQKIIFSFSCKKTASTPQFSSLCCIVSFSHTTRTFPAAQKHSYFMCLKKQLSGLHTFLQCLLHVSAVFLSKALWKSCLCSILFSFSLYSFITTSCPCHSRQ